MSVDDLEDEINRYIDASASGSTLSGIIESDAILVLKYTSPAFVNNILSTQCLYINTRNFYTWGDALYVTPLKYPRATMMYGNAGIVGSYSTDGVRFFDAINPQGLDLYQQWIRYQKAGYDLLTTTVHANTANRDLRNDFRSTFRIDCVFFRPDEPCANYTDPRNDIWLALTHWTVGHRVASGGTGGINSDIVKYLEWCVLGADAFQPHQLGFAAALHTSQTSGRTFTSVPYAQLEKEIRRVYGSGTEVLLGSF